MVRTYLHSVGCTTAAGAGVGALYARLLGGESCVTDGVARISGVRSHSQLELLTSWLTNAYAQTKFEISSKLGVILSSTKGAVEDSPESDPLSPVLSSFLAATGVKVARTCVVSNACASSHGALFLAQRWIQAEICDSVIVAAVEAIGPFIENGFRSLQAVSPTVPRPFTAARMGLALGEGAAVLVVSKSPSHIELGKVSLVTEGVALTRPSSEGLGLERACREIGLNEDVDLIVAHATGTIANDAAEARVYGKLAPRTPVTGTKWCIGHTLGVSGAVDVLAAMESIRQGEVFSLATSETIESGFSGTFLTGKPVLRSLKRVVVSSLGFGGMNAALCLQKAGAS